MYTYQEFYIGENRVLKISVLDRMGQPFLADSASISVLDSSGTSTMSSSASVLTNNVYASIGNSVTSAADTYTAIWTLNKGTSIYKHVTKLRVSKTNA